MAGRYDKLQATLDRRVKELRDSAAGCTRHPRTPEIIANLQARFEPYLEFAQDCGAIITAERTSLADRCWTALKEAAQAQDKHHAAAEPTERFVALLSGALASGHAHIADRSGNKPDRSPQSYGWRRKDYGNYRPQGACIGWTDGDDIYLEPTAVYQVVQRAARAVGDALPVSEQTLKKRLREQGLLASVDAKRETLTIRRSIGGVVHDVLHFHRGTLLPRAVRRPGLSIGSGRGMSRGMSGFQAGENPPPDNKPDHKSDLCCQWLK